MKLDLKKPIVVMGETYAALQFTEPTGVVIAECGVPIKSGAGELDAKAGKIDAVSVHNLMIRTAGVPREVIDMLCPQDWMAGMTLIMGFFGDTAPATDS